jgi:hypothetical protein
MRSALLLTLSLSCASLCFAQSPATTSTTSDTLKTAASVAPGGVETRTERIRVEDGGSRIDELRIGGETRSISVQPKGRMPAYQVQPESGERSWKILGF